MSRKRVSSQNLMLTVVLLIVIGSLLGASSFELRISSVGAILVLVAAVEVGVILTGFTLLRRRVERSGQEDQTGI